MDPELIAALRKLPGTAGKQWLERRLDDGWREALLGAMVQREAAVKHVLRRLPPTAGIMSLHRSDGTVLFEVPPPGTCKVVVATNVAETSITIPDVGFVVDAGRVKEERYDPQRHMASLDDVYVSRSSAKQRRGRAGRVLSLIHI